METLLVSQPCEMPVQATHIENPVTEFVVEWDAFAFRNVMFFADGTRWARVRAETAEGAVQIARYHYGQRGRNFHLKEN